MEFVNGKTRTCGLIGNPVEHTLSPLIHNTLSGFTGLNQIYVPLHVETGFLEDAVKGAYALNFLGMNVTVPYKSDVISYVKEIDPVAKNIGAVNTLVRMDGGYKGYNTDMLGLFRGMQSEGINIEGEEIILIGAGGAARAVAFLCAMKGAKQVYLMNRTLEKAELVANEINEALHLSCVVPMKLEDYGLLPDKKYLAIQGTSIGLHPNVEAAPIMDPQFYEKVHTGYDLIYNPEKTKFMQLVEDAGGKSYNGLKMLLYQGVIAFELFTGKSISEEQANKVHDKMMKAMKQHE